MIKKILILNIFFFITIGFSQQKAVENLVATPNPFKDYTTISFESKQEQGVFLVVKNILGKTVFRKGYYTAKGVRKIVFKRNNLASGMYIYTIQSKDNSISKRFIIK